MSFSPFKSSDADGLEELVSARGRIIFSKYDVNGDGVLDPIEIKTFLLNECFSELAGDAIKEVMVILNEDEGLPQRLRNDLGFPLDEHNNLTFEKWLFGMWDRIVRMLENEFKKK